MSLVTREQFPFVVQDLSMAGRYSVDTETTGLRAYLGDRLFSIIIGTERESFYFNFQEYDDISPCFVLPRAWILKLRPMFGNPDSLWYAHNAKFDLAMLAREGLSIRGGVHCTEAVGRIVQNDHFSYSLAESAKRIGLEKSDAVDEYIAKHKLFTVVQEPGKKTKTKIPHYDRVPFSVIAPYGQVDATITRALGEWQVAEVERIAASVDYTPTVVDVLQCERRLTKVCFAMEAEGICLDLAYTRRALEHERQAMAAAVRSFRELSGMDFLDSNKLLAEAFTKLGEQFPTTEKGNPSFTDEVLAGFTTPLAQTVRDYRDTAKKVNTYYLNFLRFADLRGVIHPNMRQAGTVTGRFSYSDPNLQNLPKRGEDGREFPTRRCFVPRPGHCFVMLDFDQMEYRMMLSYAGETQLIELVKGGMDVHAATAQMMGVPRETAKTINFMLLYGGGAKKLAASLGVSLAEAYQLKELYFSRLPRVERFIDRVIQKAKKTGVIRNWAGRRCLFKDPNFAYAAPNHLIQGGCADVVKQAMLQLDEFLQPYDAKMLVQVHDEILFEIPEHELQIVPELKAIMEKVYPGVLPLTCGVDHSWRSWADKVEGGPSNGAVALGEDQAGIEAAAGADRSL